MRLVDRLGFGPKREHVQQPDGSILVKVTPPAMLELPTQSLKLTADQFARYMAWHEDGGVLIQDALPELTFDQREVLMTGIGAEDFAAMHPEQDE